MTLEDELPRLFDELADHHVVGSPPSLSAGGSLVAEPAQRRTSSFAWVAAAACLLLMVGGLAVLAQRDSAPATSDVAPTSTPTPSATNPSTVGADTATILAPPANSEIRIVSLQDWDRSGGATGAVVSPDGTVFSIGVSSGPSWLPDQPEWNDIPTERRGTEVVAGYEVAAVVDESATTQIYRTVRDDCWSIEIVTADEPMWSDDVSALVGASTSNRDVGSDEAAISFEVPPGWTSLGGARADRTWSMNLQIDVDGQSHDVYISQVPDAPVGLLVTGESNPVPFDHDGEQWWSADIVTTSGMTSVIGETNLGAFVITSDLSVAQLVDIIDGLTPTPVSQLPAPQAPTDTAVPDQMTDIGPTDTALPGAISEGTAPAASSSCGMLGTGLELVGP